ncbi:MAG: 3-isopropylmalate dehydratase small subunit [Thaumarchaeota archaeon CSP1-1]|nr:MAG: 3-isopropylmalate dehydratase small subunit [Thaumarchaeota archaeon CSP1-1]
MDRFKKIKSIVTPFDKVNVDTDQIVPKQFLKLIQKTGFGKFLFYNWRFNSDEKPNSGFILNDPKYKNSKILITQDNFGCGSSREHAVWALQDYGFSVIIAPSFADIFFSNCFKNGLLAIILNSKIVEKLLKIQTEIEVDLENQIIKTDTEIIPFQIDEYKKKNLLNGLDEIALTLKYQDKILEYEKKSTISSLL